MESLLFGGDEMPKIPCGWTPPREHDLRGLSSSDSFLGIGCVLEEGHACEDHLLESKLGRYFLYRPQLWCDSPDCECADSDDTWYVCGDHEEITKGKAQRFIKQRSK